MTTPPKSYTAFQGFAQVDSVIFGYGGFVIDPVVWLHA
jgi:hypothetical protein